MYCHFYASPNLDGCAFIENSPDGLYAHATSSPQLEDCSFSGHTSRGLACDGGSPTIEGCRFFENGGIGLRLRESSATITGCSFWNNYASDGGALYLDWDYSGTVMDCLFYNNTAAGSGGAVWCGTGAPTFINCTMAYNDAGSGAGGIACGSATVTIENTIIAFSTTGEAVAGSATLSCCDLYGNAGGDWVGDIAGQFGIDGNISEDPLFCNPPAGDFTLPEDSPCAPFSPPNPECGLIGSEPVVCDPSGLGVQEWPRGPLSLLALPNPAAFGTTLHLNQPLHSGARVEVLDASGRLVWRHSVSEGAQTPLRWSARDLDGSPVPAGVYHIRAIDAARQVSGRVVIIR
ncbi:MAG: right-handed parallel beta-helix repeat-containing protein [Candidatus Eisenbacteria sp.]|nr:right-handed parallel beta-helix repeat-containing protein [Candidatus Eisenbacteria bacterium]